MIKSEPPEANGEEAKPGNICHNIKIPSAYQNQYSVRANYKLMPD